MQTARLDADNQTISIGDHRNDWTVRQAKPFKVQPGEWHQLRVALNGSLIAVYADDADDVTLSFRDPDPLPAGWLGLRTWNSEITFRNLEIRQGRKVTRVDFRPPTAVAEVHPLSARQRALAAYGRVLMNLNEFLYID